jgi:hypothetical protein
MILSELGGYFEILLLVLVLIGLPDTFETKPHFEQWVLAARSFPPSGGTVAVMFGVDEMTTVSIHQPTYLPWAGFFQKLHECEIFIVLDNVQLPKNTGSWVNRTRLLCNGNPLWLTVPLVRPRGLQRIDEARQVANTWKKQHRESIHQWYRTSRYYSMLSDFLDELYDLPTPFIGEFDLLAIEIILKQIESCDFNKIVMASSLPVTSSSTQRLVDLIRQVGGTKYLSGRGSDGYLDQSMFERAGIELEYQKFVERERPQLGVTGFVDGLSIIDSLLNVGVEQTNYYLQ